MFLLWRRQLPRCGDQAPASVPLLAEGRSSPTNTPVFPPSSLILPRFLWFYGCESWTVKKAEWQRIDAFELWCWRRLLRVPWTARRSKQSILKEISPGCFSEGMILKPKLQYFGHLMRRAELFIGKDSDAGRDWGQEEKGMTEDEMAGWHHWLDGCEAEWTPGVGDGQGGLACCDSWGHKELDTTEQLNWTDWCILFSWSGIPVHSVLHALLCLNVYSWCIHGERRAPCPPTPPSPCSVIILHREGMAWTDMWLKA